MSRVANFASNWEGTNHPQIVFREGCRVIWPKGINVRFYYKCLKLQSLQMI